MTSEQCKKLDEAKRLLAELEVELGKSVEEMLPRVPYPTPASLMFASMELGQLMAAKKALEEL